MVGTKVVNLLNSDSILFFSASEGRKVFTSIVPGTGIFVLVNVCVYYWKEHQKTKLRFKRQGQRTIHGRTMNSGLRSKAIMKKKKG
jgi:hypothetical protein